MLADVFDKKSAESSFLAAAETALAQLEQTRANRKSIDAREANLMRILRHMLPLLSEDVRMKLLQRIADPAIGIASDSKPREGTVYEFVLEAMKRKPNETWTAPKLKQEIQEQHKKEVSQRVVANELGYLAKTGRVFRIAHGHYVVMGAGLVTTEPMPDHGTSRISEHDW